MRSMLIAKLDPTPGQPGRGAMTLAGFTGRLLVVVIIAALAVALWQLTDILVLLFGAILLAIGLCAAARLVSRSHWHPPEFRPRRRVRAGALHLRRRSVCVRLHRGSPIGRRNPGGARWIQAFHGLDEQPRLWTAIARPGARGERGGRHRLGDVDGHGRCRPDHARPRATPSSRCS